MAVRTCRSGNCPKHYQSNDGKVFQSNVSFVLSNDVNVWPLCLLGPESIFFAVFAG